MALVFGLAPLAWLFVRRTPEACGLEVDGGARTAAPGSRGGRSREREGESAGATLARPFARPAFWVFALCSAVYGLVASGIALFNESILAERGFDPDTYYRTLVVTALTALVGNFARRPARPAMVDAAAARGGDAAARRFARRPAARDAPRPT